jgi:hypothetical protein
MARRPPGGAVPGATSSSELEEKTIQLLSVQRNYELMSRLMQAKQREVLELQAQYANEQARAPGMKCHGMVHASAWG